MNVDTSEPWRPMSTPETDADLNLRNEFEAQLDALSQAAKRLDEIRGEWHAWRSEFVADMRS